MFYSTRFNASLAAMNIPPTAFSSEMRSKFQTIGKSRGLTPQEAALVLVANAFGVGYPTESDVPNAVMVWRQQRKIFDNKPEVRDALIALSLY
jgi:hypothetical protein